MTDETDLYFYKATVRRVVDGDTVDLDVDLGMKCHVHERIRFNNFDAPETYGVKKDSEEYQRGLAAKIELQTLLPVGREVFVKTFKDKTGKYGRYIAQIFTGGINVGEFMVSSGHEK
ncbi:MAG: thermonuclease family protein [Candidatus Thorarchaeota archaeon]|nr:MAG: nuclease [Candidatus Fermentibacteria bacterium]HEC72053.1 thermonuclease family protein [Thermoplasmatales archaeon]